MLINANALSIPLAAKSVHTVVTSPPYYGLRDYGTAKWEGGDPNCDHKGKPMATHAGFNERYFGKPSVVDKQSEVLEFYKNVCGKCGAIRIDEQIGLEQTPDEYIANLVAVFRECKRILRDDGTLWVNIGDSYATHGGCEGSKHSHNFRTAEVAEREGIYRAKPYGAQIGLKEKDLIGIPWMLAFALRADGWYLRQDIIWAKPNPMPESVKDRCTKSHEYIFLLSKSAKYYYDSEAVKEPSASPVRDSNPIPYSQLNQNGGKDTQRLGSGNPDGRNKRDVWTVTTKPYKGAHYATFNPELIKPCILAGAPETCCAECGAPYERVTEVISKPDRDNQEVRENRVGVIPGRDKASRMNSKNMESIVYEHKGYQPTCNCNAGTSSGIVFDPFVGSGTTVATAIQLGRKGIGIDLSFKYLHENAKARVDEQRLPLMEMMRGENANTIR